MARPLRKPALLRNPKSVRNRRRVQDLRAMAGDWLGSDFIEPGSVEETDDILRGLAAREIDWIIIDGGDGTVRDILTALPDAFPDRLPYLSIIPSGNTNVIAADVGMPIRGPDALAALRAAWAGERGEVRRRPSLEVRREANARALRGMFFGVGIYRRAVEMAHNSVYHDRLWHGPAVAAAIAAACFQIFAGRPESPWRAGENMLVKAGDMPEKNGQHFLLLATTLQQLVLGIWPFWDEDKGPIQFIDVDAPPKRLAAALWWLLRGLSPDWIRQGGNYRSRGVNQIQLNFDGHFVLDGETYPTGPAGIQLLPGPAFDYFRP